MYFSHLAVVEKASVDGKFCLLLQCCDFSSCIYIEKEQLQSELCLTKTKFRHGMYMYFCAVMIINTQNAMCSGSQILLYKLVLLLEIFVPFFITFFKVSL